MKESLTRLLDWIDSNGGPQAVDMFIFCCYTGFHYCDREALTNKHAFALGKTEWIEKIRRKTRRFNARATVKLSPQAVAIIAKYGGLDGLPKLVYRTNYEYIQRLGLLMGLPFKLATGNARNTFAYHCLNEWGFDMESTASMMGLKDTSTIRKYSKVERRRVELGVSWEKALNRSEGVEN